MCEQKEHFNMSMCTEVHAILYLTIIWFATLRHGENTITRNTYLFLSLWLQTRIFIKFMFRNRTKTEQRIKLTEISELSELFSFLPNQGNNRFPVE